jgi:medium-chain acyl-[acyl-carrier-protein] hydrolase
MKNCKWFIVPKPNPNAEIKLFCFPYAGGSSYTFQSWPQHISRNIEVVIIQPPGRGSRMFEPLYFDMNSLVNDLIQVFPEQLNKPYILFGHSLGSRVAFEILSQLSKIGCRLPIHFIASGSGGPHLMPDKDSIYHLPDKDFIAELKILNGTPKSILENKELMDLFLPLLKADFEIADNYCYSANNIFHCPITIFGGESDIEVSLLELTSWGDFFTKKTNVKMVPGNHFFIDNKDVFLPKLNEVFDEYINKIRPDSFTLI